MNLGYYIYLNKVITVLTPTMQKVCKTGLFNNFFFYISRG